MMRFLMPLILIAISVSLFLMFSNPLYKEISALRMQVESYDKALANSKALESERDKLTAKFNSINREDLNKIQKLLPENIDNIRLILEIEQIAAPYGMVLKDVRYNAVGEENKATSTKKSPAPETVQGGGTSKTTSKDYGV